MPPAPRTAPPPPRGMRRWSCSAGGRRRRRRGRPSVRSRVGRWAEEAIGNVGRIPRGEVESRAGRQRFLPSADESRLIGAGGRAGDRRWSLADGARPKGARGGPSFRREGHHDRRPRGFEAKRPRFDREEQRSGKRDGVAPSRRVGDAQERRLDRHGHDRTERRLGERFDRDAVDAKSRRCRPRRALGRRPGCGTDEDAAGDEERSEDHDGPGRAGRRAPRSFGHWSIPDGSRSVR